MGIIVNLDMVMVRREMGPTELSNEMSITMADLPILKNSKVRAIRFTALEAVCKALDCRPGDILQYVDSGGEET